MAGKIRIRLKAFDHAVIDQQVCARSVGERRPRDQQAHAPTPVPASIKYKTAIRIDTPLVT